MSLGDRVRVYLVGAGPGNPDFLTVKAHRLLRFADVVLHDDLVTGEILALASPSAEIINAGKRCGAKGITQTEINALMIDFAKRERNVVRLHGGDPAIFGRMGEEIDALRAAGVRFEIVPGVTTATAAAASLGFSLTDRRKSSRVIIVSGHRATEKNPERLNWKEVAREDATLVIYMPGSRFTTLREELLEAGLSREIPAALVSRAATARQRVQWATLGSLDSLPHLESPAVLLIGWPLDRAKAVAENSTLLEAFGEADLILSSL